MAFSSGGGSGPMADMNVTPLVDVMLVLLIIFMITAPVMTHKISIDLPQPSPVVIDPPKPIDPINLMIRETGGMEWNNNPITLPELQAQLAVLGVKPEADQPELRIKAADTTEYDKIASVMGEAKRVGVKKIGFEK